jgi:uncharacterized membrane protein HdeD (DUF308 family)
MSGQSPSTPGGSTADEITAQITENRGIFIALGLVLIVVGIIAIGAPHAMTIVAKVFLGWVLLMAGVSQVLHAFATRGWRGFLGELLVGALYIAVGVWLAFFPLAGIISLTVLLAATFVADGLLKLQIGWRVRPESGWFWMIVSGIVAIVAGVLLVMGLPSTATWAIGLLAGVNILVSGIAFLSVALGSGGRA